MADGPAPPHLPRLISRRFLLGRTAVLAAAAGGLWLLRDKVIWPAPRPAFGSDAPDGGWLPLQPDLFVPVVDATVEGRPVRALIDSGAQASVVDAHLAGALNALSPVSVPMMAFGVSGKPQAGRAAVVDVRLGALSLPRLHVAALDLAPLAPLHGRSDAPAALVIGQDVLRTVALQLDYPSGRVALRRPGFSLGATAVPARKEGGELVVDVAVEGFSTPAVVDTGLSAALALSEELAAAAGLLAAGRDVRTTRSVTLGGASRGREVLAETVAFAGRTLRHAPVAVYTRSSVSLVPRALLGSGAFRRTPAVLDLGAGRLELGPAETPVRLLRVG